MHPQGEYFSSVLSSSHGTVRQTEVQELQSVMDGIFPRLLPLLMVILSWWLIAKKRMSATKVILILTAIVTVGVLLGVF